MHLFIYFSFSDQQQKIKQLRLPTTTTTNVLKSQDIIPKLPNRLPQPIIPVIPRISIPTINLGILQKYYDQQRRRFHSLKLPPQIIRKSRHPEIFMNPYVIFSYCLYYKCIILVLIFSFYVIILCIYSSLGILEGLENSKSIDIDFIVL